MKQPFFSIIIPTRNRYETLNYAISTVLNQDFNDFELIISDNSDPANHCQFDPFKGYLQDIRIRFYRPENLLSMSDHWEFAVSKTSGEFIILFGDDDGLVAGALQNIYNIIQRTKTDIVSWARVEYSWPDRIPSLYSNYMVFPYKGKTGIINSTEYIKKVIHNQADYRYLPMLYNSAVSKKIIDLLREKTGRVFNASSPDIYTGYAFAYLIKKYITVGYPLSINGVSSKSNGAAHSNNDESIKAEHWALLKKSEIKWPQSIPRIYTSYLGIIEPFVQLTNFFPELNKYISRRKIYQVLVDSIENRSEQDLKIMFEIILHSAKNDKYLYKWLTGYIEKANANRQIISDHVFDYSNKIGFDGSHLVLDASKFGLKNVYDVSLFIKNLFGNLKDTDYFKPVNLPLIKRIKRAAGIIIRGI